MPSSRNSAATGIETAPTAEALSTEGNEKTVRRLPLSSQHLCLTQVVLADTTDRHNELVQERQWLLHPSERVLALRGNLFVIEDMAAGTGTILVKRAPLPHARPVELASDLRVAARKGTGFEFSLLERADTDEDKWTVLDYTGGRLERTRALHDWQRAQRPATPGHTTPRLLCNTWGDRSRDSRIQHAFIEQEIRAARQLGADVIQIDDGWQKGTTSNSAQAQEKGGVWAGFWGADPEFWQPHPERFPHGLAPLVELAKAKGVALGLWFAPDSSNDLANWRRDADRILELHRTLGIEHFKVDSVKATTDLANRNLHRFLTAVLEGSSGKVVFDLDITSGVRPGYFGALGVGPLFVENRYTDWHNYWPHQTLRNLWALSRWVDPRRLRMEFLNNTRNDDKYAGDPLAPSRYAPDALFASVMFSNPLGWFEVSNLTPAYRDSVAGLVSTWREHREELFRGTILPIGSAPDGFAPTGFLSLDETGDCGYLLAFRELHSQEQFCFDLPELGPGNLTWDLLGSEGGAASCAAGVDVTVPLPLGFVFARFTRQG